MLNNVFFDKNTLQVAKALLGKIMRVKYQNIWLSVKIIETEAYLLSEKSSHASLGFTEKRKALFMPAGTIYMYYSRAGDSMNVSTKGKGNAVLIKSGVPYITDDTHNKMITIMQTLNPHKNKKEAREPMKLCSGQTLLCKSLGLTIKEWDQKSFNPNTFYIEDVGYQPTNIIQTKRLGITPGRDEDLPYRFIDASFTNYCTRKP